LVAKGLLKEVGRKEAPGKPVLYGTTPQFLHYFGLESLEELPDLKEDEEVKPNESSLEIARLV
jgi:segregation and condensation protein B